MHVLAAKERFANPFEFERKCLMRGQHLAAASTSAERVAERRLREKYEPAIREANEAGDIKTCERLQDAYRKKLDALVLRCSARVNRLGAELLAKAERFDLERCRPRQAVVAPSFQIWHTRQGAPRSPRRVGAPKPAVKSGSDSDGPPAPHRASDARPAAQAPEVIS